MTKPFRKMITKTVSDTCGIYKKITICDSSDQGNRGRPPAKRKSYDHVANGRPPDDLHVANDRPPRKSRMITWRPAARQTTLIWRAPARLETYDDHDCRPPGGPRLAEDSPPGKSLIIMWRPAVSQMTLQMRSHSTIYGFAGRNMLGERLRPNGATFPTREAVD